MILATGFKKIFKKILQLILEQGLQTRIPFSQTVLLYIVLPHFLVYIPFICHSAQYNGLL